MMMEERKEIYNSGLFQRLPSESTSQKKISKSIKNHKNYFANGFKKTSFFGLKAHAIVHNIAEFRYKYEKYQGK